MLGTKIVQTLGEGLKPKISNSWGTKNIINPLFIYLFLNFIYLFIYLFWIFLKNKKIVMCQAVIVPLAMTEWCGSDNVRCQYYAKCHFLSLNLVSVF